MFLRVHLSVSISASFILADVLAVLQVLWYYSLFYDRCFAIVSDRLSFSIISSLFSIVKHFFKVFLEAPPRLELGVRVLQTRALPLGYGAV